MSESLRYWLEDQLDWIIPVVAAVILSCVILGSILGFAFYMGYASCRATSEAMGVNWSWGVYQDCMIVVDGKNIPMSAYKVVKISPTP